MNKKIKISRYIVLTVVIAISLNVQISKSIVAQAFYESSVNLILDSPGYNDILSKNFRKTSNLKAIESNKNLNLKGLENLDISGSQQFSEHNLPLLIKAIGTSLPMTVVDLRQESHGFINGFSVSWADSKNNANVGLTREKVILDEVNKLESIKLDEPISFYNHPKEVIVPTKVENEYELVKSKDLSYNRITVRDGGIPSDDMVDYFIESIKNQQERTWLHFHCKEGIGRTTTFMIMYDIIRNYKDVTLDQIIERQLELASFNENDIKSFRNNERLSFLKSFYDYCTQNGDSFNIKWSEWKKESARNNLIGLDNAYILNLNHSYKKIVA
ncbi:phytase [Clostridium sp.]|uniref:fused DSP-PTPase phosphatase/NAD kinase-like protein n=1 Tax=Clostridium sp. TaxID=1506 RepID=UPI0026125F37|nr:phytase [Clostridium sp.]